MRNLIKEEELYGISPLDPTREHCPSHLCYSKPLTSLAVDCSKLVFSVSSTISTG